MLDCHVFIFYLTSPRCGSVLEHGSSRASPNRSSHSLCPSGRPSPSSLSLSPLPLSSPLLSPSPLPGLHLEVGQKDFPFQNQGQILANWSTCRMYRHHVCVFYPVSGQPASGLGSRTPVSPSQLTVSPYEESSVENSLTTWGFRQALLSS